MFDLNLDASILPLKHRSNTPKQPLQRSDVRKRSSTLSADNFIIAY